MTWAGITLPPPGEGIFQYNRPLHLSTVTHTAAADDSFADLDPVGSGMFTTKPRSNSGDLGLLFLFVGLPRTHFW